MKPFQICLRSAIVLSAVTALCTPSLGSAQYAAPTAPTAPKTSAPDTSAQDLKTSMTKMQADMGAVTMTGNVDRDFATMMRIHHQGAVEMAKMEIAQGKDKQMKQFAQNVVAAQTKEIAILDKWLSAHQNDMKK